MMAVGSPEQTEVASLAGDIQCPGCAAPLRPRGHARTRTVRGRGDERLTKQPRCARCAGCGRAQVLLPAALSTPPRSSEPHRRPRPPAAGNGRSPPTWARPSRRCSTGCAGCRNARPLAARAGGAARFPPLSGHSGPSQPVAEPAGLELEYLGWRRAGPLPPGGPRASALDPDRALHPR